MSELTSRDRFTRMFEHREADRVPVVDRIWAATIERWRTEGLPAEADVIDYFGLDRVRGIPVDTSPRFEATVIEETPEYTVRTTPWGATLKNWSHAASTPEFLDFTIVDRESWQKAKARMTPDDDRIDWARLREHYPRWVEEGAWIQAAGWFGFDVTHSWIVGTERVLIAMMEDPEWLRDMFTHEIEVNLALLDKVWDAGYRFDGIRWPDDMGYKGAQFFSLDTYRDLEKPIHKRVIDWAHAKGVKAILHSCGDINPFVPELVGLGLDALNPIEVKAGMNPVELKKTWGDRLVFHGGINAALWDRPDAIKAEMERVVPEMKKNGGYIFSSDHSVPSSVSFEEFREIVALAKRLGEY